MPGIWLSDDDFRQTAGQIWGQQVTQRVQAGHDWATQAMQSAMQQTSAAVQQLTAPPPAAAPPPAPPPPMPTPAPAPEMPTPGQMTPAPTPPPVQAPTPEAPPTPAPAPTPAPDLTPTTPTSTPTPSDTDQAGQNWAQQQIQNLLNPSQPAAAGPQTPPDTSAPPAASAPPPTPQAPQNAPAPTQQTGPLDQQGVINYVQQRAQDFGIDPAAVLAVAKQEGLNTAPGSSWTIPGEKGPSFGPSSWYSGGAGGPILAAHGGDATAASNWAWSPAGIDEWLKQVQQGGASGLTGNDAISAIVKGYEKPADPSSEIGRAQAAYNQFTGGVQNAVQQAPQAVNSAVGAVQSAVARVSQFGMGLSPGDAMAFCGPAAALAFAQTYGRNPTVDEAKQLAQQVGWNPSQGMAGAGSEVALLKNLGVDAHMTQGVDWSTVAQDASSGNPVIVDTPGHYFYVDGYDADSGKFHLGSSATDLKAAKGQEWFSPDQIPSLGMGDPRAAIFADHPLSGPGQAAAAASTQPASQLQTTMGGNQPSIGGLSPSDIALGLLPFGAGQGLQSGQQLVSQILSPQTQSKANDITQAVLNVGGGAAQAAGGLAGGLAQDGQDLLSNAQSLLQPTASAAATDLTQAPQSLADLLTQNSLLSQGIPTAQNAVGGVGDWWQREGELAAPYQSLVGPNLDLTQPLGPQLGFDPYGQIVQQGIPKILQGIAGGNVGDVLGGGLQTLLGAASVLPGTGGPEAGALGDLLPALGSAAPDISGMLSNLLTSRQATGPVADAITRAAPELATGLSDVAPDLAAAPEVANTLLRQPGLASSDFARLLGGGAAGGFGTYQATDPNDPLRLEKTAAGALAGGLAAGPGLDLAIQAAQRAGAAQGAAPGAISAGDWARGIYRGGVIGGLNTMADVAFNSTITPALSGLTGAIRDLASFQPGRLQGRYLGAQSGITDWTNNFLQGLSDSLSRPTSLTARASPGLPGVMANLAEGAGALHGAFQNATSQLIQQMERGAAAGESASAAGLSGPAWFTHFQGQLTSPPADVLARAQAMGERTAARGDLGTLTSAFGSLVNRMGPVGDALFPVYRMGMALGNRMVESSPLGLAGTGIDVARGMLGQGPYAALQTTGLRGALGIQPAGSAVGPIGERLTNNVLGTLLSGWLANQAIHGNVTGDGPSDPGQRQVWLADGNQPNSFRAPDGNFYSWDKLPPQLRGPMMAAGAYADAAQAYTAAQKTAGSAGSQAYGVEDPRWAAATTLLSEVGRQLASATPMRTFAELYDALQTGGSAGNAALSGAGYLASGIAGGAVPMSGLVRSIAQMTDPTQRQALNPILPQQLPQSVLENVAQNIPGAREQLPQRVDVLGRAVNNPQAGLGQLLPARAAAGQATPLLQAMQSAGVAPGATPTTVPYGPSAEIRLNPAEQRSYATYRGQMLQQMASSLVNSPQYAQMPQYAQQAALQQINSAAGQAAERMVLRDVVSAPNVQQRVQLKTGPLAPAVGYSPDVMSNQLLLQQMQQNAQHQALVRSLLGSTA